MSSKRNSASSTISTKPAIDPALQWIGGAASDAVAPSPAPAAQESTSQLVNMKTSQQASKTTIIQAPEFEATAMLSARVPVALIRQLRIRAATEGRPIQEIIADLLRGYLDTN